MNRDEIKRRVLERIKSPVEWPSENHGTDRMGLLQVAYDQGWWVGDLN